MYDVFGLGNPLVDTVIKVAEEKISELDLTKGSVNFVDEKTATDILNKLKNEEIGLKPAGDVVNTMMGIANLGGKAVFCGKVGDDKNGLFIEETLTQDGIKPTLIKGNVTTGSCTALVTPDFERTMITHLGAAITLNEDEVIIEDVKNSKIIYVTGYILEEPNLRQMALKALKEAKKHEKKIAIDVSDPSLVKRCKEDILKILKEFADIIIANEDEAKVLTEKEPESALKEIAKMCDIAIVKLGKEGALISDKGTIYEVKGFKVEAVDTTGAGDMFAAGFLFGITNNYSVAEAATIANYAASKIVQEMGGRLSISLKDEIKDII